MNNKKLIWLIPITLILLVIIVFYFKSTNETLNDKMPTKVDTFKKKKSPIKSLFQFNDDTLLNQKKDLQTELEYKRKKRSLELRIPFNTFKTMKDNEGNTIIEFFFEKTIVGFKGDLDAIEKAVSTNDTEDFLISIEPFSSNEKNIFKRVSFNSLKNGFSHLFKVQFQNKKATPFALIICRDKKVSNTCIDKKATLINDLIDQQKAVEEDYVYYFQSFVIDNDSIRMIKDPRISNQNYNDFAEYLNINGYSDEFSKTTTDKIKYFNEKISSIPVLIKENTLSVHLPYQNKDIKLQKYNQPLKQRSNE